ncbi:hypothetical protein [Corynebacterium sp. H130]|uniref:hypothetical protein n=1 Tax=Corynebacterium sp. H130 TaxID=3133444 RepID=UPI0030B009D0
MSEIYLWAMAEQNIQYRSIVRVPFGVGALGILVSSDVPFGLQLIPAKITFPPWRFLFIQFVQDLSAEGYEIAKKSL